MVVQKIFTNLIRKEWNDFVVINSIVNSINNMQDLVEACIDAKGSHNKY